MELNKFIEHTLLKQDAAEADFERLFEEAKTHKFWGVCVNPAHVKLASEKLAGSGVKVVTVVGFPLGASKPEIKAYEAALAVKEGADEVDMVINVTDLKSRKCNCIVEEIVQVKRACGEKVLKVIIETDLLTKDEIRNACELCVQAEADFVKTSTGFVKGGVGAKVEDVEIMSTMVSPFGIGVKASGGIKTREQALALVAAGATRLGTSSGVAIVAD